MMRRLFPLNLDLKRVLQFLKTFSKRFEIMAKSYIFEASESRSVGFLEETRVKRALARGKP